ncbi:MAG: hypothetical protein HY791_38865 [Deltaproteobacteria bacterium]|nr:hypothetical protein [Deltaproteobacteria bacterium]
MAMLRCEERPGGHAYVLVGAALSLAACSARDFVSLPPVGESAQALLFVAGARGRETVSAIDARELAEGSGWIRLELDVSSLYVLAYPHPLGALWLEAGPANAEPGQGRPIPPAFAAFAYDEVAEQWVSVPQPSSEITVRAVPNSAPPDVAVGADFSCARFEAGQVACWGEGERLGVPGLDRSAVPVFLPKLKDVRAIGSSDGSTCALQTSGRVSCWGTNDWGLLGRVTARAVASEAEAVDNLADAVSFAVGTQHACAVTTDGSVSCWGKNDRGETGTGPRGAVSHPEEVSLGLPARQVAVGEHHSCALLADGSVWCWGANEGDFVGRPGSSEPGPVRGIPRATELTAGRRHTCVRLEDGEVRCWGSNARGQLGVEPTTMSTSEPLRSSLSGEPGRLFAGRDATCVAGPVRLICVGSSTSRTTVTDPIRGALVEAGVSDIAFGRDHACAVDRVGVSCWGSGAFGQLGIGFLPAHETPVELPEVHDAVDVFAGGEATCVRRASGEILCLGLHALAGAEPGQPAELVEPAGVIELALTNDLGCVRTSSRSAGVWCWGHGLADMGLDELAAGGFVTGTEGAAAVDTAGSVACVVKQDGSLWCWGSNNDFQLGFPAQTSPAATPGRVPLDEVRQVALTEFNTCALSGPAGDVFCWGGNNYGLLGSGRSTILPDPSPVRTRLVPGAVELAAGYTHLCARMEDGRVFCWGENRLGQLGESTAPTQSSPVAVAGLSDAIAIEAGENHSCAIREGGSVVCFGSNAYGQLGNAGDGRAEVAGLHDAVRLASGNRHACALRKNGRVACWGLNSWGQLGQNEPVLFDEPQYVSAPE